MGLLIKNGTIVSAVDEFVGDILVEDEKIKEIGVNLSEEGHEIVDATGKYVFPGGVDEHVHLGPFNSYSFETSHAAVVGGTTTVVDFAPQFEGMGLIQSKDKHNKERAEGVSTADYSFHSMVMDTDDRLLEEIPHMAENGLGTVKLLMAYNGTSYHANDELIFKTMQIARDHGITVMLHCENGEMIAELENQLAKEGKTLPINWSYSRPALVEDEATRRGIYFAELADCPTFIVHVTTEGAMNHIKDAQERGLPVYGETCTHYLILDESYLNTPDMEGAKFVCAPALRPKPHQEALWKGVRDNDLMAVSSDHAAYRGGFAAKSQFQFPNIPPGAPGMQERLAMLWSQGVDKGRISRQRFVEIFATNPAKMVGLYPQKGLISPGADADIVIYDPEYRGTITLDDSYEGTDYSTYEGFERIGIADKVYLRGKLMAERGILVGEKGNGQYIKAKPYGLAYQNFKKEVKEKEVQLVH